MKLVYVENNRLITDSLIIADSFGKRHADVLRSIESLECSQDFTQRNFALSDYTDSTGRKLPKYLITQDGFSFLVMGYTGKEAAHFKEMYINEFNRMKEQLTAPTDLEKFLLNPDTIIRLAENWKMEKNLRIAAETKIEADKPLVHFAESLQISKDSILVADLAKILKQNGIEFGEKRLFKYLREEGYLIKSGSEYNMPTQRSMELKIFEIKMGSRNSSDGTIKITRTPKVTGKGQIYFINKLKEKVSA